MTYIVEMARGEIGEPNHLTFACSGSAWKQLLPIAKSFGWNPKGTIPDERMAKWTKDYDRYFQPTYDPEEWAYCKKISKEDARNIATALIAAAAAIKAGEAIVVKNSNPVIFRDDLTQAEFEHINSKSIDLFLKFADFAFGGSFAFAWDD